MTGFPARRRDILTAIGALAAAACAAPGGSRRAGAGTFDWTVHAPEQVGMTRAGLDSIRNLMRSLVETNVHTGNVVALARHNKLVMFEAQGVRDIATGAPMRTDDIFRMMSSTKVVTAVAVMMLVEEGKLSLDDAVSRFIPSFNNLQVIGADGQPGPLERPITVRHLLTHTSGLNHEGEAARLRPLERKPDDTLADLIPRYGNMLLDFQPGSKWQYSGLPAFDVLLYLVQHLSGAPADAFLRERVFEPLDMRDSHFNVPVEKASRVLTLYARENHAWRVQDPVFGSGAMQYMSGAGGLLSTAHDFMQFEQMLYNRGELNGRRLLKSATVDLMSRNHVGDLYAASFGPYTVGMGFGLGVKVAVDPSRNTYTSQGRGSFGWSGAYGTETWVDPENDLSVVYFVQQPSIPALVDFQRAVCGAVGDTDG